MTGRMYPAFIRRIQKNSAPDSPGMADDTDKILDA